MAQATDSLSCISDSKAQDLHFHKQKLPGFRFKNRQPPTHQAGYTSVSVLGLSIKLKPAVLLNSGEFWGETADQNRGGFEHMQMTQSVILFRHESLCVRFLRYSDRNVISHESLCASCMRSRSSCHVLTDLK